MPEIIKCCNCNKEYNFEYHRDGCPYCSGKQVNNLTKPKRTAFGSHAFSRSYDTPRPRAMEVGYDNA